jgi:glyoxylase-like metal-dependent hydrolase (beta-lactamase superfamily II)
MAHPRALITTSVLTLLLLSATQSGCGRAASDEIPKWRVFAIRYGQSKYRESSLIRGGAKDKRVPFSWYTWLIVETAETGKKILVDTGFVRGPKVLGGRFQRVDRLLGGVNAPPESITDVVITHMHWDHVGNLAPYEKSRVWLQEKAYQNAKKRLSESRSRGGGLRLEDLRAVEKVQKRGQLALISGKKEIATGVTLHEGGGHSAGLQWVAVQTGGPTGTIVLATDHVYLYRNIEERTPTGSTRTPDKDLEILQQMLGLVKREALIIPGHDPEVFRRFPKVTEHIVEIKL